jgi:preprotein translocase subunit YajC
VTQFLTGFAQAAPGGMDGLKSLFPFVLMFAVLYFLILRPQSKKQKEHARMLSELKKGDLVVTQGGIIGNISGIKDNEITLQVQEGVRLRVTRASVTGLYNPSAAAPKAEAKAS